jgi:SNF2 family DNA or RNA helicase
LNKYLVKVSLYIRQYEHPEHGKKWFAEGKDVPEGYVENGVSFYKRRGLTKKADEELLPHQEAGLKKLDKEDGIITHWSVGSGKTKFYLKAIEQAQKRDKKKSALIIAPAPLQSNVDKEIKKHKLDIDRKRLTILSYEKAVKMADELAKEHYSIAVADEAHKLRNAKTKRTKALGDIISGADKRILATATANYNSLEDISPLINIAARNNVLPEDAKAMENKYVRTIKKPRTMAQYLLDQEPEEEVVLANTKDLKDKFNKYISYYDARKDPDAKKHFPTQTEEVVEVEMSPRQEQMYHYVEGRDLPFMTRMKIRNNLPLKKKERQNLNAFSSGVRQASNSIKYMSTNPNSLPYAPKIEKAVGRLRAQMKEDPNFKALVYSNYLDAGVNEYSQKLRDVGVKHNLFTGGVPKHEKDRMLKEFNDGKTPVLLISGSGSEGLDTKGTKLVQLLDPHWNGERLNQTIGRANRYKSHEHLPEKERTIRVEHYRSILPKPLFGDRPKSIDQYMSEHSDDKSKLFKQVRRLMENND